MQTQLHTSKSENWCTPKHILERVAQIDTIGLDPCTNIYSLVDAVETFDITKGQDGLMHSWVDKGLVFVNPPYGRKLQAWTKKIVAEALMGAEIVALVTARTDTKWFHENLAQYATSILFWKGRIHFIDGITGQQTQGAPFPSALVYFGNRPEKFREAFADAGLLVDLKT